MKPQNCVRCDANVIRPEIEGACRQAGSNNLNPVAILPDFGNQPDMVEDPSATIEVDAKHPVVVLANDLHVLKRFKRVISRTTGPNSRKRKNGNHINDSFLHS